MRILLVDNYDSFTWNIEHILVSAGAQVDVVRNDAVNPHAVVQFDGLVLSPGPGVPYEAGQLMRIIPIAAAYSVPTLGVCLGMQAIAEHFGGTLRNLDQVLHGQARHPRLQAFDQGRLQRRVAVAPEHMRGHADVQHLGRQPQVAQYVG